MIITAQYTQNQDLTWDGKVWLTITGINPRTIPMYGVNICNCCSLNRARVMLQVIYEEEAQNINSMNENYVYAREEYPKHIDNEMVTYLPGAPHD